MEQKNQATNTQDVRIGEITAHQLSAPSGLYEDDGVTPISNDGAIDMLQQMGLQVYKSTNGFLSPEARETNRQVYKGELDNGRRTVAVVVKRPIFQPISWRASDQISHR